MTSAWVQTQNVSPLPHSVSRTTFIANTLSKVRRLDRILCDEAEVRNKERKLLGKVVSSKVIKRGGLSKERNSMYTWYPPNQLFPHTALLTTRLEEIQALFKKGKPLPYLGKDIAAEKALRDAAVKELEVRCSHLTYMRRYIWQEENC